MEVVRVNPTPHGAEVLAALTDLQRYGRGKLLRWLRPHFRPRPPVYIPPEIASLT
jgi:hypothetical protein